MASVTEVTYNAVDLGQVRTLSFQQEPIYDSQSHTDMIGVDYRSSFQFLYAVSANNANKYGPVDLDQDQDGNGEVQIQNTFLRLKLALEQPRKKFVLKQNGVTMIDTSVARGVPKQDNWDDFNGPQPGSLRLIGMFSKKVMILEWSCSVKLSLASPTTTGSQNQAQVNSNPIPLSIKYTQSQDIDERGYSTISTNGELKATAPVFRDADFNAAATVDSLRRYCLPILLPGYRRRSRYQVSADGTVLNFSFTDRQLDTLPPSPAFEASGTFGVTGSGGIWHGDITLTLKGGKDTDKQKLIETATSICLSRIIKTTGANINNSKSWNALWGKAHGGVSFREDLFDNSVSVAMRFLIPPKNLGTNKPNQDVVDFGKGLIYGFLGLPGLVLNSWKDTKKAEGEPKKQEQAVAQNTGNTSPQILTPNDAIKQIGSPLPGVEKYGLGIWAGGTRGGNKEAVLLVAGFMRDPAISQQNSLNKINQSGIRGPVLVKNDDQATERATFFENPNAGKPDGFLGRAAKATLIGSTPTNINGGTTTNSTPSVVGTSPTVPPSSSADLLTNYTGGFQNNLQPTTTGWSSPASTETLSDGMEIDYLIEGQTFEEEPVEAYDTGIYSLYECELEYHIKGKNIVVYPTGGDGIGTVHQIYAKEPAYVIMNVKAIKSGSAPTIPFKNVDETEKNLVYADSNLVAGQLELGDDFTPTYTITGWVKYYVLDSDKLALRPPVPPYLPVEMEEVSAIAFFDDSLLNITTDV